MEKVKIQLVRVGHMPAGLNWKRITKWKSELFSIDYSDKYDVRLDRNADIENYIYSDRRLRGIIVEPLSACFTLAVVGVPIQNEYFSRLLGQKRGVLTFFETKEFLVAENIPLENFILRALYTYTLIFLANNRVMPEREPRSFFHDETRGCLFDMNVIKSEIVESCSRPIICDECKGRLADGNFDGRSRYTPIANDLINTIESEIRKIRKPLYYRVIDFAKIHPIMSLAISGLTAVFLGIVSSLLASFIFDAIK